MKSVTGSVVVYHDPSHWAAVPAKQRWERPDLAMGRRILVGFTRGTYSDLKPGTSARMTIRLSRGLREAPTAA